MALQDARAFVEALEGDRRLAEEVRAEIIGSEGSMMEAYVAAGERRGHHFSAEELGDALGALRDVAESAELDKVELEEVAGGEMYWPKDDRCSDTFSTSPTENCWHDDRCRNIVNFYNDKESCTATYEEGELCWLTDYCSAVIYESSCSNHYYGAKGH